MFASQNNHDDFRPGLGYLTSGPHRSPDLSHGQHDVWLLERWRTQVP